MGAVTTIPKGKVSHVPPITSSRAVWIPLIVHGCLLFIAQPLSPQVCCCLFLNSCYSGATSCVQNTKHPASLSLVPSLTVGDLSHHRLASIRTTVDTSDECQPKSPLLVFLPHSLGTRPCTRKHTISLLSLPSCLRSVSLICLSSSLSSSLLVNVFVHREAVGSLIANRLREGERERERERVS